MKEKRVNEIMNEISEDGNLCIIREALRLNNNPELADEIMENIYDGNSLEEIREALENYAEDGDYCGNCGKGIVLEEAKDIFRCPYCKKSDCIISFTESDKNQKVDEEKPKANGIKEKITEILNYLADEDTHFFENCTCKEKFDKIPWMLNDCKCNENKNHIWRTREEVKDWLESPYCPLVDENELGEGEELEISYEEEKVRKEACKRSEIRRQDKN